MQALTLGWELEVEAMALHDDYGDGVILDAARTIMLNHLPRSVVREVKDDCTLRDGGAELVSEPLPFAEWQALRPQLNAMLREFQTDSGRWRSWNGGKCGFHIHVGREELTARALARLMDLVYLNVQHWEARSGREDFAWCPFDTDLHHIKSSLIPSAKASSHYYSHDRTAVHMSSHNTVEFRLWRGSLLAERFWRNLEETHAIAHFAASSRKAANLTNYFDFVQTHDVLYPTLVTTLPLIGV